MMHLGIGKSKTGEQRNNQEQNQWIGEGKQEARDGVTRIVVLVVGVLHLVVDRIVQDHIGGIDNQDDTTQDLQHRDVAFDKVGDKADAQSGEQAIEKVASRRAQTCEEPRLLPLVQCALHSQNTDGSHRRRQNDANRHATNDK